MSDDLSEDTQLAREWETEKVKFSLLENHFSIFKFHIKAKYENFLSIVIPVIKAHHKEISISLIEIFASP